MSPNATTGAALPGGGNAARFIFGLVGFIAILAILESYDKDHGTEFVTGYAVTTILGILIYQRNAIAAGLADLQAAINASPAAGSGPAADGGKATSQMAQSGPATGGKAS